MLRRFAVPVLIGAIALSAPGLAFAKWTGSGTGSGYSKATALTPVGTVTATNSNSTGGTTGTHCVTQSHNQYVKVSWAAPSTTFTGETYDIAWTEQTGGANGADGSTTGATGTSAVVQVLSSGNSGTVSYTFTVTSRLQNWSATGVTSSTLTTDSKC